MLFLLSHSLESVLRYKCTPLEQTSVDLSHISRKLSMKFVLTLELYDTRGAVNYFKMSV